MSELPAITTAPVGRKFIQVYTKPSTKNITLGFWGSDVKAKRQHGIEFSTTSTLTATTPKSQIADVNFYGATAVLGFVPNKSNTNQHSLAFLSPAFKVLSSTEKTSTLTTYPGLAGLTMPGDDGDPYLYFMSPISATEKGRIREYNLDTDFPLEIPATVTPNPTSPLGAYYHAGGTATGTGTSTGRGPIGQGRYVVYIEGSTIKEAIVSDHDPVPITIVTGATKFDPNTGLAVVHDAINKNTFLYFVAPGNKLMRTMKRPNSMMKWDPPIQITTGNPSPIVVKPGAQLAVSLQGGEAHIFWPMSDDANGLGHAFDNIPPRV